MITPRFGCSQTDNAVVVSMYCPSIRAADAEINVDETMFTVHVNPYFLRLNFSKALVEDDDSSANYDPTSGYLTVTLTKQTKGEVFEDLDLLAKLLAPRPSVHEPSPSIEMLHPESDDLISKTQSLSLNDEILEASGCDWQLPQELPELLSTSLQVHYGFLNLHSGYLRHATHTENEINELGDDAESCSRADRTRRRLKHEDEKWDEEHYMADFMDDEYIQALLEWIHPHISNRSPLQYTEKENMEMLRLPRKEYLATEIQTHDLYLTLITLLFAYLYDSRTSQHDPTPESAWTICNLIPAFSALDPPHSSYYVGGRHTFSVDELKETLLPSYRRLLAFPLYRSFALAEKCQEDLANSLKQGKRPIIRCLLEMKDVLDHHDVYYIYSKIWLDDFCVWIQSDANDDILGLLGKQLMDVKVDKAMIAWGLEELEIAAQEALAREKDSDDESSDTESTDP